LLSRLTDFGRAFLKDIIKEQIEDPEEKKKSKRK
jgi:hypothetical protein